MRGPRCYRPVAKAGCFVVTVLLMGLAARSAGNGQALGAGRPASPGQVSPAPVATCLPETALLFRRPGTGQTWQVVKGKEAFLPEAEILGVAGAALDSRNGAVRLSMKGDLSQQSPFPVLGTAVILHEPGDADLDFTFERGRVDLTNNNAKGPARVRIRGRDRTAEITLIEPGASVALELYGRWNKGVPFSREPSPGVSPTLAFAVLATKGETHVKGQRVQFTLRAPPGPALILGIDLNDIDPAPEHLEELPAWATGAETEKGQKAKAALVHFYSLARDKSISAALDELVTSDNEADRRVAVFLMGALDELPRLGQALSQTKHPDVLDAAVLALRHWIGRGPGQDQKLYLGLIDKAKYPPALAEKVLNLLHSFGDEDLAVPETYEMLIDYLESDRQVVRGLAYWHLFRLVPEGRKLGYDPLAPKEERAQAGAEWHKLIPPGRLPPGNKPNGQ